MFSERLKVLRNQAGLSQAALGRILSMSQQAVAKWETGAATPNPDMLAKIAGCFGVSVDDLIGDTTAKNLPAADLEEDEELIFIGRKAREMTPEQRKRLSQVIRLIFEEDKND